MKKSVTLIALSALAVLVGCQRELVNDTPEETGVKEVTTQFVLNVAAAPQTKMTADVVQQNHNFRGMENVKMFVYNTGMVTSTPATSKEAYVLKTTGWADANAKFYDLGLLYSDGSVHNEGDGDQNQNVNESSNRVLTLSIPVGADAVTIYGKAIKGNNASSAEYGGTNMDATKFDKDPDKTVIAAQRILDTEAQVTAYDATAALMIFIINDILDTNVPATTDPIDGFPGSTYPVVQPDQSIIYNGEGHRDLSWDALGHQYEIQTQGAGSRYSEAKGFGLGRTIAGLEEVLGRCYYLFTYIKEDEYRTGSSGAVKRMIMDMYSVIKSASDATPTNEYEANAKRLARTVLDRAELYFLKEDSGDLKAGDYKSNSDIHTLMISNGVLTEEEWQTAKFNLAKSLNGYPFEDFGIPRGAAQLAFTRESDDHTAVPADIFSYKHPNAPLVNPNMTEFDPIKYLHPAELWYYVNSPIRTTDKSDLLVSQYPNGVNPWKTESSWTDGLWQAKGKVQSSTRGVAVKNSINYGVALLKSSVALVPDAEGYFYDNRADMTEDVTNRAIKQNDLKLELSGILVGGVNPRMNWQFTRKNTTGDLSQFDCVIYDASLQSKAVPTVAGGENYTLVYDNYNSDGNQDNVYIALEFKNIGDAFWGRDNLIPKDGYFYLVGLVAKPSEGQIADLADKWPTDHQIPPVYDVDATSYSEDAGKSKKIARVFIQDFVTAITFKLKENSLQNAYYTMPDLRASQMSLGLSVDLQWIEGLSYPDIPL